MAQIKKVEQRVQKKRAAFDAKAVDPYAIIGYPLTTEKSIRMMESDNKLIFMVDRRASKPAIKQAIEQAFNVKIDKVSTQITPSGKKKAYVRLSSETPAMNVATKLELL